jgi:hypothetical protein
MILAQRQPNVLEAYETHFAEELALTGEAGFYEGRDVWHNDQLETHIVDTALAPSVQWSSEFDSTLSNREGRSVITTAYLVSNS